MGKKKIVVIDDEPDIITYLTSVLQDNGFDVFSAANANEGLKLICSQRPDLVCLDILMPEESGFSVYRKIKEESSLREIPVLIISGLNLKQEMPRLLKKSGGFPSGIAPEGYIEKPVDLPLLIETIQRLTGKEAA